MLTIEEAEETYAQLVQVLRRVNLAYVVDQVADQIRLGRSEKKNVQVQAIPDGAVAEVLTSSRKKRKGKTEVFTENVEFNSFEKLELLVRAIERVTIELVDLHSTTAQLLRKVVSPGTTADAEPGLTTFQFMDESQAPPVTSSPSLRANFERECSLLKQLLTEVKEVSRAT